MFDLVLIASVALFFFLIVGHKNPQRFLIFFAVFTIPFPFDTSIKFITGYVATANGFTITLSDVFLAPLLIYGLLTLEFPDIRVLRKDFVLAIAVFLFCCMLSVIGATWRLFSYFEVFHFSKNVILYYLIPIMFLKDEDDIIFLGHALLASLFFQSGIGVIQFYFQDFYNLFRTGLPIQPTTFNDLARSHGTLGQPNVFASFIVPILLFNQCILMGTKTHRVIRASVLILGLLALVFSFSRAGWVGFAVGFILLVTLTTRVDIQNKGWVYICLGLLTVTVLCLSFLQGRLTLDDGGAAEDRWYLMKIAFEIIKNNFFFGVGLNNYGFAMNHYVPANYDYPFVYTVHNVYLLIFAETGIIGFFSLLLLFLLPIAATLHLARNCLRAVFPYAVGLFVAFVTLLIQNLVDITWASGPINALYFLLMGYANGAINVNKIETQRHTAFVLEMLSLQYGERSRFITQR